MFWAICITVVLGMAYLVADEFGLWDLLFYEEEIFGRDFALWYEEHIGLREE